MRKTDWRRAASMSRGRPHQSSKRWVEAGQRPSVSPPHSSKTMTLHDCDGLSRLNESHRHAQGLNERSRESGDNYHPKQGGVRMSTIHLHPVSYTHLRAHETGRNLVCRL